MVVVKGLSSEGCLPSRLSPLCLQGPGLSQEKSMCNQVCWYVTSHEHEFHGTSATSFNKLRAMSGEQEDK